MLDYDLADLHCTPPYTSDLPARITMGKGAAKGYLDTEYGTDVFIHLPGSAQKNLIYSTVNPYSKNAGWFTMVVVNLWITK